MFDGGLLMGGTLTIRHGWLGLLVLLRRGTWSSTGRVGRAVGYLRVRTVVWTFAMPAPVNSAFGLGWWVAGRCLRTAQWTRASVAKFLRAHGGCLGTRNR